MDLGQMIKEIEPLKGEAFPIRTLQQTQPVEEFGRLITCRGFPFHAHH